MSSRFAVVSPPFGTHALPSEQEAWRQKADQYQDTKWGRMMISRCRKKALLGQAEPFDVTVTPRIKARLYPSANRCEKRAFAGVQVWDAEERTAIKEAVAARKIRNDGQDHNPPFVFLDVGANVGLYALFAHEYAVNADQPARIVAIEPGLETCARLEANIAASEADIQIIRSAVSNEPGSGFLGGGTENRGEARLVDRDQNAEPVVIDTLARICRAQGITHIDAMKMDIEGHELASLKGFFEDAPERLHPSMLIVETRDKVTAEPVIEFCRAQSYMIKQQTRQNTIFVKADNVET